MCTAQQEFSKALTWLTDEVNLTHKMKVKISSDKMRRIISCIVPCGFHHCPTPFLRLAAYPESFFEEELYNCVVLFHRRQIRSFIYALGLKNAQQGWAGAVSTHLGGRKCEQFHAIIVACNSVKGKGGLSQHALGEG